jgi:Na+/melibiose symporter-like transporter
MLNLQIKILFSPSNSKFIIMSENLDATTTAPQGKGMAVTGFILALAGFLLNNVMFGIAVVSMGLGGSGWLMYLWLVVNILSIVLSVMAMSKLKKTGGKRGLAIAGMIIGIVGTVWAIILTMGLAAAASLTSGMSDDMQDAFREGMKKEIDKM